MRIITVDTHGNLGRDFLPRLRFCLDIDGVLADFVGGAADLIGYDPAVVRRWDYYEDVGETPESFWDAIHRKGSDFWADLQPYDWLDQLYDACRDAGPTLLLTSPSSCPSSAHGKTRWIQAYFGRTFKNYLLGSAKEFCAGPGAVLIDDSDANCNKFIAHGGRAILFPQPWNENRDKVDVRMDYVLEKISEVAR